MDQAVHEQMLSNPVSLLEIGARTAPEKIALKSSRLELTYSEMYSNVVNLAAWLSSRGIRPGDRIAVAVPPEFRPIVLLALMHQTAVSSFPPTGYKKLSKLGIKSVVTTDKNLVIPGLRTLIIDNQVLFGSVGFADSDNAPKRFESADSLVKISFSSGTTGEPKAVPLSLEGTLGRFFRATGSGVFGKPHFNLLGYSGAASLTSLLVNLYQQSTILISSSTSETVDHLVNGSAETLQASPAQLLEMYQDVIKRNLQPKNLRHIYVSGAKISSELVSGIEQTFHVGISSWYGASEVGSVAVKPLLATDSDSIGELLPGVEVRVIDESWQSLPAGVEGMFAIKTPGMAKEYIADLDASKQSFRDGWFRSGDYAISDDDGKIRLVGRTAELSNIGGIKVRLQAIDEYFTMKLGVKDAASFLLPVPGGEQLSVAFVMDGEVDPVKLLDQYKRESGLPLPANLFRTDSIPRSEMGKALRNILVRRYSSR